MEVIDHPPALLISSSNLHHLQRQQQQQSQQQQQKQQQQQQQPVLPTQPFSHQTTSSMKIGNESVPPLHPDLKRCFDEFVAGCQHTATETAAILENSHAHVMKQWESTLNQHHHHDDDDDDDDDDNNSTTNSSHDNDDAESDQNDNDDAASSDVDSVTDEQENRLVKHLVQAAFAQRLSPAQLSCILATGPAARKRARRVAEPAVSSSSSSSSPPMLPPPSRRRLAPLGVSESAPCLRTKAAGAETGGTVGSSCSTTVSPTTTSPTTTTTSPPLPTTIEVIHPPQVVLQARLQEAGRGAPQYYSALSLSTTTSFFYQATPQDLHDYDMSVVQAVRTENVDALRHMHSSAGGKRSMNCVNAFGETILHIAARRGAVAVVQFLVNEARVNVRVACDFGRTPLHDACWTAPANLAVVQILLAACPDLLYLTDKRGHAPLQYVHRENWAEWKRFLQAQSMERLTPNELPGLVVEESRVE